MKFKVFDTTNVQSYAKHSRPTMRITRKTGTITFNSTAAKLLSLSAKSQVKLLQSEDEPQDWFVQIVQKDGFQLRLTGENGAMVFNSSAMVAEILKSVASLENSETFRIGETLTYGKIEATALINLK